MNMEINYNTSDKEVREAWFKYKKSCTNSDGVLMKSISAMSFVAGFNAGKHKDEYGNYREH